MGYKIEVHTEYVRVMYTEKVDLLDWISVLSADEFINNVRRLKRVIHDYSLCVSSDFTVDNMRELSLLINLESNFTEKCFVVIIPIDQAHRERFGILKATIKSDKWVFKLANNTTEAIALLK
jgi:ADP-glucose pyrophosphorylase